MYDFIALSLNDRAKVLWEKGTFLSSFTDEQFAFALYSLNDYYVEVSVSLKNNNITEMIPFRQGWRLEKHLAQISLRSLSDNVFSMMKSKREYHLRRVLLEIGLFLRELFSRPSYNGSDYLASQKYEAVVKLKNEYGIED